MLAAVLLSTSLFDVAVPANAVPADGTTYRKDTINAYTVDDPDTPLALTCLYREDLPEVPYISIEDGLNQLFTTKIKVTDNGSGTFTYTNDDTNMVVDTEKDTISFDCCEMFMMKNGRNYFQPETPFYLEEVETDKMIGEVKGVTLNLSEYGIDITAADGNAYVPYCTCSDIVSNSYCAIRNMEDGLHFFDSYGKWTSGGIPASLGPTRDKTMAAFEYNELCLIMDNLYGKPPKAVLAKSISEMGFDKTLSTYSRATSQVRELLLSQNTEDYLKGMMMLNYYLYDGGYTSFTDGLNGLFRDYQLTGQAAVVQELFGESDPEEAAKILQFLYTMSEKQAQRDALLFEKGAAHELFQLVKSWNKAALWQSGNTYLFDFNGFEDEVVEPFKWSMDYAAEHGAKYFVIDLTTNTGGSPYVARYMMNLMFGDDTSVFKTILSGNQRVFTGRVDKNLDGKFDEKDDEVKYNFRCAILTSQFSYSCANSLPCISQDNGIVILSETSGGGCCNVVPRLFPDGSMYYTSGSYVLLRKNGEDSDGGAVPDAPLPAASQNNEGFYDIEQINASIDKCYDAPVKPSEEKKEASAESKAVSEAGESKPSDKQDMSFLYWLVPVIVVGVAAAVIVVIFVRKKKS